MLKQLLLSAGRLLSTSLFAAENPHVVLTTSYGDIEVAADDAEAFQRLAKRMLTQKLANAIAAEKEMGDGC